MPLTDDEKARALQYLGYPDVESGVSVVAGSPVEVELTLQVRSVLEKLNETAVTRARIMMQRLESTENLLDECRERLAVVKLGEITLRDSEPDLLEAEYRRWAERLADLIGARTNPYSVRFKPWSIQAKVQV